MPAASLPTTSSPAAIHSARVIVVLAALLWSSGGFFAKSSAFAGWPGPLLAFWRVAFACVIILPLVRKPSFAWLMIPCALAYAGLNYTYLMALSQGTAANAIWLQCTAPVWVLLVGVLLLREKAVPQDWTMMAFAGAGTGLILVYELGLVTFGNFASESARPASESISAVLYGLTSGLLYATVILILRRLRHEESAWLQAVNHLVTALCLAPFFWASLRSGTHWPSGSQWWMLAGFGILQLGLPYVLFTKSLKTLPGHEASGIALIEPVLVPVWVCLAYGEFPRWWTVVGGGLIFIGLLIRYWQPKPTPSPGSQ